MPHRPRNHILRVSRSDVVQSCRRHSRLEARQGTEVEGPFSVESTHIETISTPLAISQYFVPVKLLASLVKRQTVAHVARSSRATSRLALMISFSWQGAFRCWRCIRARQRWKGRWNSLPFANCRERFGRRSLSSCAWISGTKYAPSACGRSASETKATTSLQQRWSINPRRVAELCRMSGRNADKVVERASEIAKQVLPGWLPSLQTPGSIDGIRDLRTGNRILNVPPKIPENSRARAGRHRRLQPGWNSGIPSAARLQRRRYGIRIGANRIREAARSVGRRQGADHPVRHPVRPALGPQEPAGSRDLIAHLMVSLL